MSVIYRRFVGFVLGLVCLGVFVPKHTLADERPNFVFIYTDDQRWDTLSCVQKEQGDKGRFPWLESPNLDKLASEGVRFRNAFVVLALCSPSRASFLTGQYGHRNGIIDNHTPFPEQSVTHASLLRAAGYTTGYIGKWHMGPQSGKRPGFDYSASFVGQGVYFDCPVEINGTKTATKGWIDDVSTDYAIDFIKSNKDKPFSLVLGYKTCHGPFTPPERHAQTYGEAEAKKVPNLATPAIYRNVVEGFTGSKPVNAEPGKDTVKTNLGMLRGLKAIDENVGKLMKTLDELGLTENTVVIYTSDNGFYLGEHGLGDKRSAYEESMRIPMLVRYPKKLAAGKTRDEMVLNIDVAPTILELAGVEVPKEMQGKSWKKLLESEETTADWRTSFFFTYFFERPFKVPSVTAVRTAKGKLIQYPYHPEWTEIFDLENDPYETKNLMNDPDAIELKQMLAQEYDRLSKEVGYHVPAYADELLPAEPARDLPPVLRPNQIVLRYQFDRVEENKILDQTENKLHGVLMRVESKKAEDGRSVGFFDGDAVVEVPRSKMLNPALSAFTLEAEVRADGDGVIIARGGRNQGFCMFVRNGKPAFVYRSGETVATVTSPVECIGKWTKIKVQLTAKKELVLSVDNAEKSRKVVDLLMSRDPNDGMQIGGDEGSKVLENELGGFKGQIQSVQLLLGGDEK